VGMWVGRLKRWSKLLNDNKNHILIRKKATHTCAARNYN
jgi:hypothetical protein